MNGRGIRIFRVQGIQVVIDYTWFIIFMLVVAGLAGYYFPQNYPHVGLLQRWLISIIAAILVFVSVLLHEFSHSLVAKRQGMQIQRIVLFIFGGIAQIRGEPPDARSEFLIAAAGPACSVVLGVSFLLASTPLGALGGEGLEAVLWYLGYVNLALVGFNLVPGFPLDGGRILRAALWHKTGDLRRSTRVVSNIGKLFAYVLIGVGFFTLLADVLVQGLFFIFIGMFLYQAAVSGYQQVALREGLSGIAVAELMTHDPVTVPAHLSLEELVNAYFFRHRFASFPVERHGQLVGMININQIKDVPREEWSRTSVQACMSPLQSVAALCPDDDAFEVLMRMVEDGVGCLPVVADGKLVGIVSRADILGFVHMRAELGAGV
ncbi:MAG: site-2 protease family protein [Acidobacteriota bacterium]